MGNVPIADDHIVLVYCFDGFDIHHRAPRIGRNPKTGEAVKVPSKTMVHFKQSGNERLNKYGAYQVSDCRMIGKHCLQRNIERIRLFKRCKHVVPSSLLPKFDLSYC